MGKPTRRRDFLSAAGLAAAGLAVAGGPLVRSTARAGEAKPRPVKAGQIGTAHAHAAGKMEAMRRLRSDYEVVGVVEPDEGRRRAAERSRVYQGLRWMTEEELLATPGLKVVAVETAVDELVATGTRCVAAGMHIHLDKPAVDSLGAFRRLLEQATTKRLTVQMGYMFRHNPAFRLCFQAVRDGWLGRICEVTGLMNKEADRAWRKQQHRGGVMFELGCHLIDILARVLGKPDAVTPYNRRVRPELDDLFDSQLAVFEYAQATATIRVSAAELPTGRPRHFTLCGTEGTIDIRPLEPPKLSLALDRARGEYRKGLQDVSLPAMPGRYDEQMAELARIARGEKESEYPPSHDLLVQELILRASGLPVE